jgi:hypothetical protein
MTSQPNYPLQALFPEAIEDHELKDPGADQLPQILAELAVPEPELEAG